MIEKSRKRIHIFHQKVRMLQYKFIPNRSHFLKNELRYTQGNFFIVHFLKAPLLSTP